MLSTWSWTTLAVMLREAVRGRVRVRVLRGRALLVMLLVHDTRGSRMLEVLGRWRTLLAMMRMVLLENRKRVSKRVPLN